MIDHVVGRPSPSWKRTQVFLVVIFWIWRIVFGDARGPRLLWIRRLNRKLQHFTPWQIVVSTLTMVYALRNIDKIVGLGAPEPLARLYSPSYYRATWIATGLDAGFATAMNLRPKWIRDIFSVVFSVYYIIYANEADEKLRRFRAVPTVEMLRATWDKTSNPYIRLLTHLDYVPLHRKVLLARPSSSPYTRPITVHLFFAPRDRHQDPVTALSTQEDLVLDFPGGGFVAMTPEHHEERLRRWACKTGKPIVSVEYGKAPEYPYPFAIDEAFDTYRVLVESRGKALGMSGNKVNIIISGDSAGATMCVGVIIKILEHSLTVSDSSSPFPAPSSIPPHPLPLPIALVLSYAALDFNFTSWMTPSNLRVLQVETEADENRPHTRSPSTPKQGNPSFFYRSDGDEDEQDGWVNGLRGAKDHLSHVSPLAVVGDGRTAPKFRRKKSWRDSLKLSIPEKPAILPMAPLRRRKSSLVKDNRTTMSKKRSANSGLPHEDSEDADGEGGEPESFTHLREQDKPIKARVRWNYTAGYSPADTPLATSPVQSRLALDTIDEQAKLEAKVAEANFEMADKRRREGAARKDAPIGTRLTMTSRTGYFQDRIISPSMMRAMAILYIGPHLNPDFASDYRISPILAPARLLAQFPPLLMQCGEKDPFVDDTIIFAGRVRAAKRERKEELRRLLAAPAPARGRRDEEEKARMRIEDELEALDAEEEEDWVQMKIFPDWSHGYLQMPSLMSEARAVIDDLAIWIEGAFDADKEPGSLDASRKTSPTSSLATVSENSTPRSIFSAIWPWGRSSPPKSSSTLAGGTQPEEVRIVEPETRSLGNALHSETETDMDEVITLVPKARRPSTSRGVGSSASGDSTARKRTTPPSTPPTTLRANRTHSDKTSGSGKVESRSRSRVRGGEAEGEGAHSPKGAGTGVMAQTLTESELMRRRRLLDSHIFESEG